ncbi:hypothetical protein ERJ75_001543300 [Trypanosoma vivax]|nr:hypothetical protein ERJ75_001543300 [Trypanosoma vivax]
MLAQADRRLTTIKARRAGRTRGTGETQGCGSLGSRVTTRFADRKEGTRRMREETEGAGKRVKVAAQQSRAGKQTLGRDDECLRTKRWGPEDARRRAGKGEGKKRVGKQKEHGSDAESALCEDQKSRWSRREKAAHDFVGGTHIRRGRCAVHGLGPQGVVVRAAGGTGLGALSSRQANEERATCRHRKCLHARWRVKTRAHRGWGKQTPVGEAATRRGCR